MLPRSHRQEALSRTYVRAVAAQAGVICGDIGQDYGIDMYLRGIEFAEHLYLDSGPQIDLQLKTTTTAEVRDGQLLYDLDARAYNLLRRRPASRPCLLVVLVLPEHELQWFTQSVDELILRHCAYFRSLQGEPATTNQATIRISIPLNQVFSPDAIRAMMKTPAEGN